MFDFLVISGGLITASTALLGLYVIYDIYSLRFLRWLSPILRKLSELIMATLNSLVIIFSGTGLVLAALALLAFIVASVAAFFFWLINRVA